MEATSVKELIMRCFQNEFKKPNFKQLMQFLEEEHRHHKGMNPLLFFEFSPPLCLE